MLISNDKDRSIGLIHSLGGCGGTLLAQCIGVLQDVVLLSECNPLSADLFNYNLNPYVQLSKWQPELFSIIENEFDAKDLLTPHRFCEFIKKLKGFLDSKNRHLVIRDYNYIDYFGLPFLPEPPMYSNLLRSINDAFKVKQVILVRHPMRQYNSLRSHDILKNSLSPRLFLDGYAAFLSDFNGCKIIKYEDLVAQPNRFIADLSEFLNLPFSQDFLEKFSRNQSVTGNLKRVGESRISITNSIITDDRWIHELNDCNEFQSLLKTLDY